VKLGAGDYRMLYTGVDADGIERAAYATSADGVTWVKQGVVLNPSQLAYAYDESGVEPTGMLLDGSTLHVWTSGVDRNGRPRGGHATTAYPTPGSPASGIAHGWATYQLGSSSTTTRDFRQIATTSTGSGMSLWVSFLQPYSQAGNEFWSAYFPISGSSQALNFLLTVHGVRWQARLSGPAGSPSLDRVDLTHAPVSFSASGSATTTTIGPSAGRVVTAWKTLTANTSLYSPGGSGTGSGTATIVNAATGQTVTSSPLNTGGDTALDLSGVPTAGNQALQVRLDLQSADGQATPRVNALKVLFDSAPAPALTFAVAPKIITFGQRVTLSGTLQQNGAAFPGQPVSLWQMAVPATTFAALPAATMLSAVPGGGGWRDNAADISRPGSHARSAEPRMARAWARSSAAAAESKRLLSDNSWDPTRPTGRSRRRTSGAACSSPCPRRLSRRGSRAD